MSSKKLENRSLNELLKKYSNSDVVTQIESNLNTYSSQEIDLNDIVLSSFVNKKFYNMDLLYNDEIDIKNYGIVEPLLIFRSNKNNKYLLLNGTKRYLILKKLHMTKVKVAIIENIQLRIIDEFIVLNLIRNNDNPIIIGYAIKKFQKKYQLTTQEIANMTNISYSQILNLIRLLDLGENCINALIEKKITYTKVRPLLSLDEKKQDKVLDEILSKNLSARDIEFRVNQILQPSKQKTIIKLEGNKITITFKTIKEAKKAYKDINKKYF